MRRSPLDTALRVVETLHAMRTGDLVETSSLMRYCGRDFTEAEIELISELLKAPKMKRARLLRELCDRLRWRRNADKGFARTHAALLRRPCTAPRIRHGLSRFPNSSCPVTNILPLAAIAPRWRASLKLKNSFQGQRPRVYQKTADLHSR